MTRPQPRARLRRDFIAWLSYMNGAPVIWLPVVLGVVFGEIRFTSFGQNLLIGPYVAFYVWWLAGRVRVYNGVLTAGVRFLPQRVRLDEILEVSVETAAEGRNWFRTRILLVLNDGDVIPLRLSGALSDSRKAQWVTTLQNLAENSRKL